MADRSRLTALPRTWRTTGLTRIPIFPRSLKIEKERLILLQSSFPHKGRNSRQREACPERSRRGWVSSGTAAGGVRSVSSIDIPVRYLTDINLFILNALCSFSTHFSLCILHFPLGLTSLVDKREPFNGLLLGI